MGNERPRFSQDNQTLSDQSFRLQGALARVCADCNPSARGFHIIQPLYPVDIDDDLGPREPHVQKRHQALASGKNFAVVRVSVENLQRFLEVPRVIIFKSSRFHCSGLLA
jgi:hypothetical protein